MINENYLITIFQYIKFVLGGGLALVINLILTIFLTEYFKIWHIYSYGIIQLIELFFLYYYHSIITFKVFARFIKFFAVITLVAFSNWLFVLIISYLTNFSYIIIIVFVTCIISLINFCVNKIYVFNK